MSTGSVWAVINGRLWERPVGEPWRLVKTSGPWPGAAEVTAVRVAVSAAGEELWVTLRTPVGRPTLPLTVKYALLHATLTARGR